MVLDIRMLVGMAIVLSFLIYFSDPGRTIHNPRWVYCSLWSDSTSILFYESNLTRHPCSSHRLSDGREVFNSRRMRIYYLEEE